MVKFGWMLLSATLVAMGVWLIVPSAWTVMKIGFLLVVVGVVLGGSRVYFLYKKHGGEPPID